MPTPTPFFERVFEAPGEPGLWLDGDHDQMRPSVVSIPLAELRASGSWNLDDDRAFAASPPIRIARPTLESMITGSMGNGLAGNPSVKWQGDGQHVFVEFEELPPGVRSGSVGVDLDLERDAAGDRDIDVDFDLQVSCESGSVVVSHGPITVDGPPAGDSEAEARAVTEQSMTSFGDQLGSTLSGAGAMCSQAHFDDQGNLSFEP